MPERNRRIYARHRTGWCMGVFVTLVLRAKQAKPSNAYEMDFAVGKFNYF